jgi:peptidoglycan/xylan/chitin deacetylase (PgdA/CDA1 family)
MPSTLDKQDDRLAGLDLPVLCYHRVVPAAQADACSTIHVTCEALDKQLRQLRLRGMTPITFADLIADAPLPKRPVMLTFDDGYRDNHDYLLPLLEKHDARAVVFALGDRGLATNRWDRDSDMPRAALMNDVEVQACVASGRIKIGSHGLTHRCLSELDDSALDEELRTSKTQLESLTEQPVLAFAYPWGKWNAREREAVARAGYQFAVATDHGKSFAEDRLAIARRIMFPRTTDFGFYKKTSRWYPRYRRLFGRTG